MYMHKDVHASFQKHTSCLRHVFNVFVSLYQSCFPLGNFTAPNVTFVWHYLTIEMCDSLFLFPLSTATLEQKPEVGMPPVCK